MRRPAAAKTTRKIRKAVDRFKATPTSGSRRPRVITGSQIGGDALIDALTGRGLSGDRTQRLTGGRSARSATTLLALYRRGGFFQRVVSAVAKDATRAGFEIKTKNKADADKLQARLKELGAQQAVRELVKQSRIYRQGAVLFFGIQADDVRAQQEELDKEMPASIRKLEYLTVVPEGKFKISVANTSDGTKSDFGKPSISIGTKVLHTSRYAWLCNDFDASEKDGISALETAYDAVSAQDSALWSVSTLLQRLAVIGFSSDEAADLRGSARDEFIAATKAWLDSQALILLRQGESLNSTEYRIAGLKEVFEFVFQNLSGVTQIPVSVLLGVSQGILNAASQDANNYYAGIRQFQGDVLEPIDRRIIDILVSEKGSGLPTKLQYEIDYRPCWEMAPDYQADIEKKRAETDSLDITSGKLTPLEAREMDPRLEHLEAMPAVEDPEKTVLPEPRSPGEAQGDEPQAAGDQAFDVGAPMADILGDDTVVQTQNFIRVLLRDLGPFNRDRFKIRDVVGAQGIHGLVGYKGLDSRGELVGYVFARQRWTPRQAAAWALGLEGADQLDAWAQDKAELRPMIGGDPVEETPAEIRVRVQAPGKFKEFRYKNIDPGKGIRAVIGVLKDGSASAIQSFRFNEEKWTTATATAWVREHGHTVA